MLPGGLKVLGILLLDAAEINTSPSHITFKKNIEKVLETIESLNAKTSFATFEDFNNEVTMYVISINRSSETSRCQMVQLPQTSPSGVACNDIEMKWKQMDLKVVLPYTAPNPPKGPTLNLESIRLK